MNDLNNNDMVESTTEELNTPDFTDTPPIPEVTETVAAVSRKGYQNKTARLLNMVFVVLLVVMGIFLILQLYLNVASYLQQGASMGIALLYTLASISTPFLLCALPFFFKFFAEVLELMDKHQS